MSGYGETWIERKRQRSIDYWRSHGVGMHTCTACSGSGYYDNHGSPACSGCGGTGKTRGRLRSVESALHDIEGIEIHRRNLIEVRRALRGGRDPEIVVRPVKIPA